MTLKVNVIHYMTTSLAATGAATPALIRSTQILSSETLPLKSPTGSRGPPKLFHLPLILILLCTCIIRCLAGRIVLRHLRQLILVLQVDELRGIKEQFLDVVSRLRRGLREVEQVILLLELKGLLKGDLSLGGAYVGLISDEEQLNIRRARVADLLDPVIQVFEGATHPY